MAMAAAPPPPARRRSASTKARRMVFGVFGIGSRLEAAFSSPNVKIGHGIPDAAAKRAETRPATDGVLFFQRAR